MADDAQPRLPRRVVLQMLAGTAIAGAIPAIATGHPIIRHLTDDGLFARAQAKAAAPGWKPEFLDQHQFETLQSFAERVIPGASRARTSEFVDQLLAVDSEDDRRNFLTALGAFEGQAIKRAGRPWKTLSELEQAAILTEASTMASGTPPVKPWTTGEPIPVPGPVQRSCAGDASGSFRSAQGVDRRRVLLLGDRNERARVGRKHGVRVVPGLRSPRRPRVTISDRLHLRWSDPLSRRRRSLHHLIHARLVPLPLDRAHEPDVVTPVERRYQIPVRLL